MRSCPFKREIGILSKLSHLAMPLIRERGSEQVDLGTGLSGRRSG